MDASTKKNPDSLILIFEQASVDRMSGAMSGISFARGADVEAKEDLNVTEFSAARDNTQ